jgi:hypothetical protein
LTHRISLLISWNIGARPAADFVRPPLVVEANINTLVANGAQAISLDDVIRDDGASFLQKRIEYITLGQSLHEFLRWAFVVLSRYDEVTKFSQPARTHSNCIVHF